MKPTKDDLISAQVVLRAEDAEFSKAVREGFERAGFSAGNQVANNFSITGRRELFETYFGVKLDVTPRGELAVSAAEVAGRYELPTESLPPAWRDKVEVILFTPKPDFGPGNY